MGFYLYKGLKKPLVFFGLKGKYIFYAVGVIGGGVISALVLSKFGLLGSLLGLAVTAGGVYLIFRRQDKYGLYDKTKNFDQILIFPKRLDSNKLVKEWQQQKNKHLAFLLSAMIMERISIGILMYFSDNTATLSSGSK
ncbi:DUF4133 domain-containing protein [Chryseobacterium sp. SLBN-27]|uniref:DUF4133 domain-containing protein n=1 Tax=Chryseobacterium sp. SLBN-27 TaxID=3042287 RepID=UPI002869FC91|nr:DUF4133 domain-containing protein [Chryseobacterium sp. SLBN-27]